MSQLTIRRPDDFHVHVRSGQLMNLVVPYTARVFARAIIMPNIKLPPNSDCEVADGPVMTLRHAQDYRHDIRDRLVHDALTDFEPLMTISLTERTTPEMIRVATPAIKAVKLYPLGATTNSAWGIRNFLVPAFHACLDEIEVCGLPLLIHAEVHSGFSMDRERLFIEVLDFMHKRHPNLKIVVEHVTCKEMVNYVKRCDDHVAATVTAHHLLINHDGVVGTKIYPHHHCLPTPKTPSDLAALQRVVLSGHPRFFFGSDSAPHDVTTKECAEGCAGCFTAPHCLPLLADFFECNNALDRLEPFVSEYGAKFYGLPLNEGHTSLKREPWQIPPMYRNHQHSVVPFMAGETVNWRVDG